MSEIPAPVTPPDSRRRDNAAAGGWGFAEATFFFIVPDVWLSRIALCDGWRRGIQAVTWAVFGALTGGFILYAAARAGGAGYLLRLISHLPGVSSAMIANAGRALADDGLVALARGAFTGVPFKIYAVHAGREAMNPGLFLLVAAGSRLARFAIAVLAAAALRAILTRQWSRKSILTLHAAAWMVFYAVYWGVMVRMK